MFGAPAVRAVFVPSGSSTGTDSSNRITPLTHHEILSLVAPFARAGWRVDLNATHRSERKIAFMPVDHPARADGVPALQEWLTLEVPSRGPRRLQRLLVTRPDPAVAQATASALNATATFKVVGPEIADMLEQLNALPVARQFEMIDGTLLARSYRSDLEDNGSTNRFVADETPVGFAIMTLAHARIGGIKIDIETEVDYPLRVELASLSGEKLQIPEDLLAVIGARWRPLIAYSDHWRSTIRVAGRNPARNIEAEDLVRRTVEHLTQTLSEPPANFHPRFRRQRWRVAAQRFVPVFAMLMLIASATQLGRLPGLEGSFTFMIMFHFTPLLLIGMFSMRELPRFEFPPLPRRLRGNDWPQA